jgi:hypothetical protein
MTAVHVAPAAGALALLLAAPSIAAPDRGEAVIARARAAEMAQLQALSRVPLALHTSGRFGDGKTTHTFESFTRVHYRADGTAANTFQRGQLDGKPATEEELWKAMGIKHDANQRADVLTWALAPLNSPVMDVSAVGAVPTGGYTLRCRVTRDAPVGAVMLVVDEKTGRKRAATIEMAGAKAKLADRIENVVTYGDDGAPANFRSSFHFKLGWIERSAEVRTERVPPPRP